MKQMKHSGYLGTALFWAGLLTICWQAANAQVPRPPMPIPNVVALMPPTARLPRPTPIPRPEPAMMPVPIPLPPAQFDHPYTGKKLSILRPDDYELIRVVCADTPNAIACSFRTYDTATGETLSCLILLGPKVHDDERALRHEMGHCNGWRHD